MTKIGYAIRYFVILNKRSAVKDPADTEHVFMKLRRAILNVTKYTGETKYHSPQSNTH